MRAACRCQLTTQPEARRFRPGTRLNEFASTLFESVAAGAGGKHLPRVRLCLLAYPAAAACTERDPMLTALEAGVKQCRSPAHGMQVALDRFDLFHAHMFLTRGAPGRAPELGLLFHAKEYPSRCPAFPVDLGFCQLNSTLAFDQRAMDLRNLLFFRVRFVRPACSARPASTRGCVG